MPDEDREELARRQAGLVEALVGGAGAPDGFDAGRVELAGRTLHRKRARTVAKVWPEVTAGLGERFDGLFADYAATNPLPPAGAGADGLRFARWLAGRGMLNDAGRVRAAVYEAARGWPVALARLSDANRMVVAVRVPWLGVRRLTAPFPRRRG
jgi:hypothetical protein